MYLCAVNSILANIMPRQERLQSATGIYHVMLRGINKQDIFEDDGDYLQTELHSQVIEGVWCGNTPALSIDRCLLWSYTEVMKKEEMITRTDPWSPHTHGEVFSAPLWVGYKYNNQICRIGVGHPYVQDLTQNAVHHYLKPVGAPDYVHYNFFKGGPYSYFGYNNPISLWNY